MPERDFIGSGEMGRVMLPQDVFDPFRVSDGQGFSILRCDGQVLGTASQC